MDVLKSHQSQIDYIRERELFRYCQSLDGASDSNADGLASLVEKPPISPNTALTALAQLAVLRLDASRAMISVVDKQTQYFIAEATKTLMLSDTRKFERDGDSLWLGCTSVPKAGRLCERTVELSPIPGKYPCFTVTDLSQDERFNQLPFVTEPPHFRFYAGTPLTTENGVNIGSLFVIDDKVRPELTEYQQDCLGTIAQIVMQTMKLNSEAEERRRSFRMSKGLQSFQDGRDNIDLENQNEKSSVHYESFIKLGDGDTAIEGDSDEHLENEGHVHDAMRHSSARPAAAEARPNGDASTLKSAKESVSEDESNQVQDQSPDQSPHSTFVRAANILRESLALQQHGGVVFVNSRMGSRQAFAGTSVTDMEDSETESDDWPRKLNRQRTFHGSFSEQDVYTPSDVMGFSTAQVPLGNKMDLAKAEIFSPLPEDMLQHLLHRYPRGKIWTFDATGRLVEGDGASAVGIKPSRNRKRQAEADLLAQYFPNVRQLLLAPLWDPSTAEWSGGCFCFSTTVRQIFSMDAELSFLMTFGNSVMAEANRLAYIAAERQKGDFIGSISHELRSPLHGILASAEFLADTEFDTFQNSLIDTISSCGRTLLDTVNHILDYSKINAYERVWLNARQTRSQKTAISMRTKSAIATPSNKEAPPLMSIYATTDVAAIAEEVVEGVFAGQVYQDISSTEIAYMSSETKGKISSHGLAPSRRALQRDSKMPLVAKDVDVILDISPGDYVFTTQPGALRRIMMNLFGNSLKYTEKGSIIVSLRLNEVQSGSGPNPDEKMLVLTVKDTGKGISSSYLQNSLYTAFSQEDVLATGVGLGLSIVKSIVNVLNGTIDFQSQIGKGTQVTVQVPLMKLPGTDTPKSTPSTIASTSSTVTSLQSLQSEYPGKMVALYGRLSDNVPVSLNNERCRVLHSYIKDWYGLQVTHSLSEAADVIIVDEKDLHALWALNLNLRPMVVLCGAVRPQVPPRIHKLAISEFVSKPFGPYKLAKAIFLCLEKAKGLSEEEANAKDTFPPESPIESDTATIGPSLGQPNVQAEGRSSQLSLRDTDSPSGSSLRLSSGYDEHMSKNQRGDFPFPSQDIQQPSDAKAQQWRPDLTKRDSRRPPLMHRATEPVRMTFSPTSSAVTQNGALATAMNQIPDQIALPEMTQAGAGASEPKKTKDSVPSSSAPKDRPPRLLLVDDNKINLRLLETFMRKRKYEFVDSAENGQLAVEAAMAHDEGYDIIFMDISMPVMNGFEATRAIREIERTRRVAQNDGQSPGGPRPQQALIIALTGLASSRDQAEAFRNGVDLFLTKPVSFKEVTRLLDNWEARGSNDAGGEEGQT